MDTYSIVRYYQRRDIEREIIETGLTLEEAQAHCQDPETSSKTSTSIAGQMRTEACGPWFHGYVVE